MIAKRFSKHYGYALHWKSAFMFIALALVAPGAQAQTGGVFDLHWNSIQSGGGYSVGGNYRLYSIIGQPGTEPPLSGNNYTLMGGFITPARTTTDVKAWPLY